MLVHLLFACQCVQPAGPEDVTFSEHAIRQVGGRFKGEEEGPLDPPVAFEVQTRCPRLTRATTSAGHEAGMRLLTVYGAGVDQVDATGALLADGTFATPHAQLVAGGLEVPVGCSDCEVYFGVKSQDRHVACLGPGYSVRFVHGRISQ